MREAQFGLDERHQPARGRRAQLGEAAPQESEMDRAHDLRVLAGDGAERAGPQRDLAILSNGGELGLEAEIGEQPAHSARGLAHRETGVPDGGQQTPGPVTPRLFGANRSRLGGVGQMGCQQARQLPYPSETSARAALTAA